MLPEIPPLPEKQFFTMGEISRLLQVPAYTLRYWESRLGLLRPSRRPSGHRRYTRADVETICLVRDLVYKRRLTLEGARKALLERKRGGKTAANDVSTASDAPTSGATSKILRDIRQEIQSLVAELSR
ncbi:MAG TPA: MerR family transcriptional regulator [Elusimicrobiota bacterium]|nr:MerR family transcriptional regulator [Elusimicrobiota bacterium]